MRAVHLLVVTAVAAERDAAARGLCPVTTCPPPATPGRSTVRVTTGGAGLGHLPIRADLVAGGVGPAASAATTAAALTAAAARDEPYDLVISAGIAGGFAPVAALGSVVVADRVVAADLGADSPDGFLSVDTLGFGVTEYRSAPHLAAAVARGLGAVHAPVLTVSTATGTAERAAELRERHQAAAEAMEGFGAAEAAAGQGTPFLEIRTVSNAVGPRDRSAWRIKEALAALRDAFGVLHTVLTRGAPPPYS
ncbi:Futalosine hydrolase OS=Streptomyces albaduncus OX=68172 GN=mqnB PE=3 SV=1 [Streptomyces griseoloalbus]|uniref:Futalosine hydrolase n=1 Tax=Streptomyces pseudogriseolus TaxID=36817 RepID=A0ABQ2TQF8_STREZ|nr:futalosine hydrolase [Streptomyces rubiginosus]GGS77817.1 Futalosine hydrolase [Streptomyces rubiginosus]